MVFFTFFLLFPITTGCLATKEYVREELAKSHTQADQKQQKKIDELRRQVASLQKTLDKLKLIQVKHVTKIENLEKSHSQVSKRVVQSIQEATKASNEVESLRKELKDILSRGQEVIRLTQQLNKVYLQQRGHLLQLLELENQILQDKMRNIDAIKKNLQKVKSLDLKK